MIVIACSDQSRIYPPWAAWDNQATTSQKPFHLETSSSETARHREGMTEGSETRLQNISSLYLTDLDILYVKWNYLRFPRAALEKKANIKKLSRIFLKDNDLCFGSEDNANTVMGPSVCIYWWPLQRYNILIYRPPSKLLLETLIRQLLNPGTMLGVLSHKIGRGFDPWSGLSSS